MDDKFQAENVVESLRIIGLLKRLYFLRSRINLSVAKFLTPQNKPVVRGTATGKDEGIETINQYFYVGLILSNQIMPMTMGEISHAMEVPCSTATRLIDWYVQYGYARRLPDPNDRRIIRIELTDKGEEILNAVNEAILSLTENVLNEFSQNEKRELLRLFQKLLDAAEKVVVG